MEIHLIALSFLCLTISYKFIVEILATYIISLYNMTDEDMILYKVGQVTESMFGEWFNKPILGCPVCMPSVHIVFPLIGVSIWAAISISSFTVLLFGIFFSIFTGICVSGNVYLRYSSLNKNKSTEDYYDMMVENLSQK